MGIVNGGDARDGIIIKKYDIMHFFFFEIQPSSTTSSLVTTSKYHNFSIFFHNRVVYTFCTSGRRISFVFRITGIFQNKQRRLFPYLTRVTRSHLSLLNKIKIKVKDRIAWCVSISIRRYIYIYIYVTR